eukprot:6046891-Pyramimonas_sp.AAC.1
MDGTVPPTDSSSPGAPPDGSVAVDKAPVVDTTSATMSMEDLKGLLATLATSQAAGHSLQ